MARQSIDLSSHSRTEPIEFRYAKVTTASTESESPYTSEASIYRGMWLDGDTDRAAELTGAVLWTRTAVAEGDWLICIRTPFGRWDGLPAAGGAAEDPGSTITTIGAASEGTETASTDTWTAGNVDDKGLAEWYVSRVVYNPSGDMKIYSFLRKRTYDKFGRLYSVSAETRVEVENPIQL